MLFRSQAGCFQAPALTGMRTVSPFLPALLVKHLKRGPPGSPAPPICSSCQDAMLNARLARPALETSVGALCLPTEISTQSRSRQRTQLPSSALLPRTYLPASLPTQPILLPMQLTSSPWSLPALRILTTSIPFASSSTYINHHPLPNRTHPTHRPNDPPSLLDDPQEVTLIHIPRLPPKVDLGPRICTHRHQLPPTLSLADSQSVVQIPVVRSTYHDYRRSSAPLNPKKGEETHLAAILLPDFVPHLGAQFLHVRSLSFVAHYDGRRGADGLLGEGSEDGLDELEDHPVGRESALLGGTSEAGRWREEGRGGSEREGRT